MPFEYKIVSAMKTVYIKATGKITGDEILLVGAKIFTGSEWVNGFNILCDYRGATKFNVESEDVRKIVQQDRNNESLFDQSKCAIVADTDLVFGLSRMWQTLSEDNKIESKIFRKIEDALKWFGMDEHAMEHLEFQ